MRHFVFVKVNRAEFADAGCVNNKSVKWKLMHLGKREQIFAIVRQKKTILLLNGLNTYQKDGNFIYSCY